MASDLAIRPLRLRRPALAWLAFASFIGPFVLWALLHPRYEADTDLVANGADAARSCLAHGHLLGCPDVSYFPLFQYLPALTLGAFGAGHGVIFRLLAAVSTASFVAILILAWRIVSRRAGAGAGAVVVAAIAAGPLLWYARSSFGETLAALLILLFVETVLSRRSFAAVAGTLWLAGITKETAFPFLLALGAVALFASGRTSRIRDVRAQLTGLAVGAALVVATNAAFNLFRFDAFSNKFYLDSRLRVHGLGRRGEFAASIWTAPNGGLLPFWPLAVLLGAAALVWGLGRRRGDGPARWPAAVLVGVAALLTGGFATWFAPFGWYGWGPRLMLPWLPVLLVLATVLYRRPARVLADWIGATTTRRAAAAGVVVLAALPHLAALRPPDPLVRLFAGDSTCPVVPIVRPSTLHGYYGCIDHMAWGKTPVWLDSLRTLGNGSGVTLALLITMSAFGSLLLAPLGNRDVHSRGREP